MWGLYVYFRQWSKQDISELPYASLSKRVVVRNPSYENELIYMKDSLWHRGKKQHGNGLFLWKKFSHEPFFADRRKKTQKFSTTSGAVLQVGDSVFW